MIVMSSNTPKTMTRQQKYREEYGEENLNRTMKVTKKGCKK